MFWRVDISRKRRRGEVVERIKDSQEMTRIIHHTLLRNVRTAREHYHNWRRLCQWIR